MTDENPYEYVNDRLGIQGKALISGEGAGTTTLGLIGLRGLQQKVKRGQIEQLARGCAGRPMLLAWDGLPESWKRLAVAAFGAPPERVRKGFCERLYERDGAAMAFYTGRYGLSERAEAYTLRASVLNLYGAIYANRKDYRRALRVSVQRLPGMMESVARDINEFRAVVPHNLPAQPRPLNRLYRGYAEARLRSAEAGYEFLISGYEGNANARKVTADVEALLNDLFATQEHKPTPDEVAAQYRAFTDGRVEVVNCATGEVYDPSTFPTLSAGTVRLYLDKWHNRVATHALRSGDRQRLMGRFKPYHSLEQPRMAGSLISVDDRQPVFEYDSAHHRPWFYNGIDLGSEAFTVWVHGRDKAGIIIDFYRQMVRNYAEWGLNLPAEIECEMNLNASFRDTFLKEGAMFRYVRIEANNARGKRIERYYRDLRYMYEKKREGWLARPFALSEPNESSPATGTKIVPYEEIIEGCLADIEAWNNAEHSKIKGMTRWEVFMAMQNPDTPPTNYKAIVPYLGYRTRTSCHTGIVKLQNSEFLLARDGVIAVGEPLIDLMDRAEGKDLDVFWIDGNDGRVLKAYAYSVESGEWRVKSADANGCPTGAFVCELVEKPTYQKARIEQTSADMANRELMSKYVATIEGYGSRRRKEIERVTIVDSLKVGVCSLKSADANIAPRIRFSIRGTQERKEWVQAEVMDDATMETSLNGYSKGFKTSLVDNF